MNVLGIDGSNVPSFCKRRQGRVKLSCRDAVAAYAEIAADGELRLRTFFERTKPPRVTLVGAGPGDPGLITVKGLAAIRASAANSPTLLRELLAVVRPDETVLRLLPEGVEDSLAALAPACRYRAVATYANDPVETPPLARSDFDEIYATSPSCRARVTCNLR